MKHHNQFPASSAEGDIQPVYTVEYSVKVTGPLGTYTTHVPGGLPKEIARDENAPKLTIGAYSIEEALFKGYMNLVSPLLASTDKDYLQDMLMKYLSKLDLS